MLCFELKMPGVGSWNGHWSGENTCYAKLVEERKAKEPLEPSYHYNFGDGWRARVDVQKVDSREAAKIRRRSKGFCGYDWMVDSILKHGEIRTDWKETPAPVKERTEASPDDKVSKAVATLVAKGLTPAQYQAAWEKADAERGVLR